jgi:hypothetical protein
MLMLCPTLQWQMTGSLNSWRRSYATTWLIYFKSYKPFVKATPSAYLHWTVMDRENSITVDYCLGLSRIVVLLT